MSLSSITEPEREIPVVYEADVVVIGGSCTGVFAAVRAARLGMDVAIVEKQNCFGGTATAGAVNVWHSLHDTENNRPVIGGLTREVLDRLEQRDAVIEGDDPSTAFRLNTEELKIELDDLVFQHDIQPFLHTMYVAPVTDAGRLKAIIVENKDGRQAIVADRFVDASGDADLGRDLGLPCHEPGALQPPTTCAKIYGLSSLGDFDWEGAVREHGSEFGLENDWGWGGPIPGMPQLQLRADTHVFNTDGADAGDLTRAEMDGRRKVRAVMDVIREYGPADASIGLADLAALLGIRETRRMNNIYQLTGDDILYGKRFPDAIANGTYRVDIHHSDGPGITFRYLDGTEEVIPERGASPEKGRWRDPLPKGDPTFYQIPLRSLVQEHIPNLIFAGRMLDSDKMAFSAVRVMVNLNQTGEAAGVACALAQKNGCPIPELDAALVRDAMAAGGSIII